MNTSKVSILIPIFNGERYLAECIRSILEQDFNDLEILIVDDRSSDGSLKIVKDFAIHDARIRWWKNPRNIGLTANSNACLKHARGEYVKFVHQDDKLLSTSAIRKMVVALDENPRASLVGSQPHLTGARSRPTIFSNCSGCFDGRRMIVTCLERNNNLIGQPTLTMFRRHQSQRGFDERFIGHMDYEMWCHLLEQGDYIYLNEPLATWRVHQNQQTARSSASGTKDYEYLRFMKIYWAKPWLRQAATSRMMFAQIYYLQKKYGKEAEDLTSAIMKQLSRYRYACQWMKHKISHPLQKLARRLTISDI